MVASTNKNYSATSQFVPSSPGSYHGIVKSSSFSSAPASTPSTESQLLTIDKTVTKRPSPSPEGRSADGSAHDDRKLASSTTVSAVTPAKVTMSTFFQDPETKRDAERETAPTHGNLSSAPLTSSGESSMSNMEMSRQPMFSVPVGESPATPGADTQLKRDGSGNRLDDSSTAAIPSSSREKKMFPPRSGSVYSGGSASQTHPPTTPLCSPGSASAVAVSVATTPGTPGNSWSRNASPNILPRNPRDTAMAGATSPKRRLKNGNMGSGSVNSRSVNSRSVNSRSVNSRSVNSRSVNTNGSGLSNDSRRKNLGVETAGSLGAHSAGLPSSPAKSPHRRTNSDKVHGSRVEREGVPPLQPLTQRGNTPLTPHPQSNLLTQTQTTSTGRSEQSHPASQPPTSSLDDEEQFMFEQRLTQDDLGVAIRKINHSGKAQLRYVKCIFLRPPSSSEFSIGYSGGIVGGLPYTETTTGLHDRGHGGGDSVSSRSTSSRSFMERIRFGLDGKHKNVSDRLMSVAGRVTGSGGHGHDGSVGDNGSTKSPFEESQNANLLLHSPQREEDALAKKALRALTWGKKNAVTIPLDKFICVRKGKTTDRTVRNSCPSSRLLSIVTNDTRHESLDIEAPTKLDRDKFASAFSRFLGVPLEEETDGSAAQVKKKKRAPSINRTHKKKPSAAVSEPGQPSPVNSTPKVRNRSVTEPTPTSDSLLPALTPSSDKASDADNELAFFTESSKQTIEDKTPKKLDEFDITTTPAVASSTGDNISESARKRISSVEAKSESMLEPQDKPFERSETDAGPTINAQKSHRGDDASHVSSLTGGVDQEIVEELHQAIIELRAELDASRAEAARAVKVAEQAIQSAENCSSSDWNSTVTHKAAEAAAQAQKKSAEAIARARMAEERLSAERKSTAFWRRQAQAAEEEAGSLKTRSAAAEVKQSVVVEELASERRKAARMFANLKEEFISSELAQAEELRAAKEEKMMLEVELDQVKNELIQKTLEAKRVYEAELDRKEREKAKSSNRMRKPIFKSRKSSTFGEHESDRSHSGSNPVGVMAQKHASSFAEQVLQLKSDVTSLRMEYELVRHTSTDELASLRSLSHDWSKQAGRAVAASLAETALLREKLAAESAMRLKLLNELQDIRVLNEDTSPLSFKFDRVFLQNSSQYEIFSELEEPLISALDGFNVTLLTFGQHGSGKTHSLLGDVKLDPEGQPTLESHGVQLQALHQLFTIAHHRTDRFKDAFSITIVEVHNEKLFDLVAGTPSAEADGEMLICQTRDRRDRKDRKFDDNYDFGGYKGKLEIRTNIDGNTVVQGLISIPINSFEDVRTIWRETIAKRVERLSRQGFDIQKHNKSSSIITTVTVTSVNIATGVGTEGKLQFVDMAASDLAPVPRKDRSDIGATTNQENTHFSNKSIDAFNDVINARCQFDRSVPYRNSTLTHLLRDSLESDTKVLLLCCVSSDAADLQNTIGTLRFASRMQKVSIGKATKHIVGSKE